MFLKNFVIDVTVLEQQLGFFLSSGLLGLGGAHALPGLFYTAGTALHFLPRLGYLLEVLLKDKKRQRVVIEMLFFFSFLFLILLFFGFAVCPQLWAGDGGGLLCMQIEKGRVEKEMHLSICLFFFLFLFLFFFIDWFCSILNLYGLK